MEHLKKSRRQQLQSALETAKTSPSEAIEMLSVLHQQCVAAGDKRMAAIVARNAGLVSELAGRHDQAESYYHKAIESNPADGCAMLGLFLLNRRMGNTELAEDWFERCRATAESTDDQDLLQTLEKLAGDGDRSAPGRDEPV